ncbi:twin-arginine translocation pathway signal protein [Helicobacter saguini]|uniref:ABC transporter substrate-binding protein n=1 Tax=Helicobacter saguini TaxID=1548018 RepID=A0A347VY06_9HELI|nr:ABC transporter substrate-binding protein [Helicobacter saguini]MWV61416.1 twin-arginine translocation pathway signal protein [Helicobacter saguini]MWV67914.1 twin-arginine translocation pathway signal protein [Helicobacter saguini]MWV70618.1 twin-arginine translocation pathway signal protein [Helicobacter saguini]MWV72523.1 twin-arginine translocation pathway signal protein [Helicobacter saguini]TLD94736.1 ABC transporter substrate-binding protein [Helicobacter saguini]
MESNRRIFLKQGSILTLGLFGLLNNLQGANDVKIGYLPITDHLVIIANALPDSKQKFTHLKFASWADIAQAFSSGAIDGAFLLAPLALKIHAQGVKIKALMAAHRNGSALVVSSKGNIDNVSKLKGSKIAIPSRFSIHYILLCELLAKNNIDLKDVKLIDMSPTEMVAQLATGGIDAFIVAEPFAIQAQTIGVGRVLILSKDIRANHICCLFCASENLYSDKNLATNLVSSFVNAANFITNNPSKASEISKQFLGQKPEIIDALLKQKDRVIYKHLKLQQDEVALIAKNAKDLNLGNFNVDNFIDSSFLDSVYKG